MSFEGGSGAIKQKNLLYFYKIFFVPLTCLEYCLKVPDGVTTDKMFIRLCVLLTGLKYWLIAELIAKLSLDINEKGTQFGVNADQFENDSLASS